MKHIVGEIHPNGKWVWTEYKKGKFDWRGVKTTPIKTQGSEEQSKETKEEEKQTTPVVTKPRTKKEFIATTARNLTEKECKEYFFGWGKILDVFVRNRWQYYQGKIGNCNLTFENSKTGKVKDFDKHPDWRPLGFYRFSVRGWNGEYSEIKGFIQSWEEIRNISSTESFIVQLVKHPHQ